MLHFEQKSKYGVEYPFKHSIYLALLPKVLQKIECFDPLK